MLGTLPAASCGSPTLNHQSSTARNVSISADVGSAEGLTTPHGLPFRFFYCRQPLDSWTRANAGCMALLDGHAGQRGMSMAAKTALRSLTARSNFVDALECAEEPYARSACNGWTGACANNFQARGLPRYSRRHCSAHRLPVSHFPWFLWSGLHALPDTSSLAHDDHSNSILRATSSLVRVQLLPESRPVSMLLRRVALISQPSEPVRN